MPVLDGDFEAFVTNLGKYNECMLVGEWVKLPTTEEEMQKVFELSLIHICGKVSRLSVCVGRLQSRHVL